jgi:hypothetical protein
VIWTIIGFWLVLLVGLALGFAWGYSAKRE